MNNPALILDLRRAAREIFDHALEAVDARKAVRQSVALDGERLRIRGNDLDIENRNVYSVSVGKAALEMAAGLEEALGARLIRGVLTGPPSRDRELNSRWQVFTGGHPLPNQESLDAAQAAFELLRLANEECALIIFLISGGGSAMMEWPRSPDISLNDLRETNRQLTSCGAAISEINSVRAAFSDVKAGGLAKLAPDSQQLSLIISDTNPGDAVSVASGPTFTQALGPSTPQDVIERYKLRLSLPRSILECVENYEPSPIRLEFPHHVLACNQTALEAAAAKAQELGFTTAIAEDICEQPIAEGCRLLLDRLVELRSSAAGRVCLISGGEFSCPVRGNGVGGRNLETVLRCAVELDQRDLPAVVLSAGTDGIDGNSPAAGAIADQTTVERAPVLGIDLGRILEQSDSFKVFDQLGDTITIGRTGTNVRDVRVLLLDP